jgi:hypothetical protein
MKINPEEILNLIARYENKVIDDKELSDWAIELVENDIESDSLILLAGMTPSEYAEASGLLKKVISELGFSWPSDKLLSLAYAKIIAHQILDGDIQPNLGCAKIGEINHHLDWPQELSDFGMISHEQTGHENIGITSESVIPEIISAAKELMQLELRL